MKFTLRHFIFLLLVITSCKSSFEVTRKESTQYRFTDSSYSAVDSAISSEITPYRDGMKTTMNEILAVSNSKMEIGNPESTLGNFVSDACLNESKKNYMDADFAIFNNGGLRKGLPEGTITRGDIFELMPFENELVILTMNGSDVKKIFNFIAKKGGEPVSGIRLNITDSTAESIYINNTAFDSTRTYKVLTSDYLSNGGDNYNFFLNIPAAPVGMKVRDAIINYLISETKKGNKINPVTDGRITNGR